MTRPSTISPVPPPPPRPESSESIPRSALVPGQAYARAPHTSHHTLGAHPATYASAVQKTSTYQAPELPPPPMPETPMERTTRIAESTREELREGLGHPTITRSDGTKFEATGIWKVVEPMHEDYLASKNRQKGILGLISRPLEKMIDTIVVLGIGALIAFGSRYVQCGAAPIPAILTAPAAPAAPVAPAVPKPAELPK